MPSRWVPLRSGANRSLQITLLAGRELWQVTTTILRKSRRALVATAYLGQGGAQLLPIHKGSTLVVDMSLGAVKSGATDPREVRTLLRRGVRVFTRGSLHAKAIVTEHVAIVGSANASHRSRDYLDEVAVLVRDATLRRHLRSIIDVYCTEPVRPEYLKRCLKAYRPPRGGGGGRREARRPSERPKLWFLGGLKRFDLSGAEQKAVRPLERQAERTLKAAKGTEVGWIRYRRRPRVFRQMEPGQWAVCCIRYGRQGVVESPAQLILKRVWKSAGGTQYAYLLFEVPSGAADVPLGRFRRRIRKLVPTLDSGRPRTRAIQDRRAADEILSWWTPAGRWRA